MRTSSKSPTDCDDFGGASLFEVSPMLLWKSTPCRYILFRLISVLLGFPDINNQLTIWRTAYERKIKKRHPRAQDDLDFSYTEKTRVCEEMGRAAGGVLESWEEATIIFHPSRKSFPLLTSSLQSFCIGMRHIYNCPRMDV